MSDILEPGVFFHIYNRGNNKENIFLEEKNYAYFLDLISKHLAPACNLYCYCLLKNHFHLLIKIKDYNELPAQLISEINRLHQPFSNLFNAYSKGINKVYKRSGSLFRKNFDRNRITNENYLRNLILYIHLNPVKHGFTNEYSGYKHSSFQTIMSDEPTDLKRQELIQFFEDKENFLYCHDLRKIRYDGIVGEIDDIDI